MPTFTSEQLRQSGRRARQAIQQHTPFRTSTALACWAEAFGRPWSSLMADARNSGSLELMPCREALDESLAKRGYRLTSAIVDGIYAAGVAADEAEYDVEVARLAINRAHMDDGEGDLYTRIDLLFPGLGGEEVTLALLAAEYVIRESQPHGWNQDLTEFEYLHRLGAQAGAIAEVIGLDYEMALELALAFGVGNDPERSSEFEFSVDPKRMADSLMSEFGEGYWQPVERIAHPLVPEEYTLVRVVNRQQLSKQRLGLLEPGAEPESFFALVYHEDEVGYVSMDDECGGFRVNWPRSAFFEVEEPVDAHGIRHLESERLSMSARDIAQVEFARDAYRALLPGITITDWHLITPLSTDRRLEFDLDWCWPFSPKPSVPEETAEAYGAYAIQAFMSDLD